MAPELRPRKQGLPVDHTYSAPYPNTIYTPPKPLPPKPPPDEQGDKEPNPKKRKVPVSLSEAGSSGGQVSTPKKRRHYGQRRRKISRKKRSRLIKNAKDFMAKSDMDTHAGLTGDQGLLTANDVGVETKLAVADSNSVFVSDGPKKSSLKKRQKVCPCCNRWKRPRVERRQSQRLVIKNYKLPFDQLPLVCKQKIFFSLSPTERGIAAQVCQEWKLLMMRPSLWSHLDFRIFNPALSPVGQKCRSQSSSRLPLLPQYEWFMTCGEYMSYQTRMVSYMKFLQEVRPQLLSLRFAFDIAHPRDDWLSHLVALLEHSIATGLRSVQMNWTCTPVRPPCADVFCCLFNKVRVAFQQHVSRVKEFYQLLDRFTALAPRVTTLEVPFPWTARSVLYLCRLQQIHVLKLTKYVHFSVVDQDLIDTVLSKMPELSELEIQLCCPSFANRTLYKASHPRLEVLDISQCQGFFLRSVNLPNLRVFRTARPHWQGPLVGQGGTNIVPCLYNVLKKGAPSLTMINKHRLHVYWKEFMYEEVDTLLGGICYCKNHLDRARQHQQQQEQQQQDQQL